jgi:hypothetical protein
MQVMMVDGGLLSRNSVTGTFYFYFLVTLVTLVVASLLTAPPDPYRLSLWEKRLMGSVEKELGTRP